MKAAVATSDTEMQHEIAQDAAEKGDTCDKEGRNAKCDSQSALQKGEALHVQHSGYTGARAVTFFAEINSNFDRPT